MSDTFTLAAIGITTALGLLVGYAIVRWIERIRTLKAADRIARSFSTQEALARANPVLRGKLEQYRLAKLRRNLGASSHVQTVASELMAEYRLFSLERRLGGKDCAPVQS